MKKHSILLAALLIAVVCSVLNLAFNEHIGSDAANFYCRMADEFAQGNYSAAYFHIIPPLTPTLAGIIAKTGLDGWMAMKLVSNLFFIAAVYWSYRLARLRLDDQGAQWCAMLYVFASRLLRYGMAGQLEAGKMFFLLFVFERLLVWLDSRQWKHLLAVSAGSAALVLARNEGIGYLILVFGFLFTADWIVPGKVAGFSKRVGQGMVRCLFVLVVCLAIWSPWIAYQHHVTGYAVLSSKHIAIVGKLMPWLDVENSDYMLEIKKRKTELKPYNTLSREMPIVDKPGLIDGFKDPQPRTTPFKLIETLQGIYPRYFIFALVGVASLLRRRQWCRMDSLLAVLFVFHVGVYWLLSPNILQRLIIPGIPLYFPWMVAGSLATAQILKIDWKRTIHRRVLLIVAVLLGLVQLSGGMSSMRKSLRGKDRIEMEIAEWVGENRAALDTNKAPPLESGLYPFAYHTGRQPVVLGYTAVPFRAQCDSVLQDAVPYASHDQLVAIFESKHLDVVVVDKKFTRNFGNFNPGEDPRFQVATDRWQDDGVLIYTFTPYHSDQKVLESMTQ